MSETAECDRKHHPYDGVCAPAWTEKLSIACSRGEDALCKWPLCGCPCHDDPESLNELKAHLWPCGCLKNDAGAHRVGCPDHPEGVRGDV